MSRLHHQGKRVTLWCGDATETLRMLPDASVNCIVSSPPYFWMRDYGASEQIGLERTPQEYVEAILGVTAELQRVLASDGTLWMNLGDTYSTRKAVRESSHQDGLHGSRGAQPSWRQSKAAGRARLSAENLIADTTVPEKSLMLLPERIAIGMIQQGWILRNRITWEKIFVLPDPAPDRLPRRTESVLLFSRSARYFWDNAGLRSQSTDPGDVWHLPPSPGAGAHTASYPIALPLRCIAAGCKPDGVVLDPFSGSGTTGRAALQLGHRYIGIDINADYLTQSLETGLALSYGA